MLGMPVFDRLCSVVAVLCCPLVSLFLLASLVARDTAGCGSVSLSCTCARNASGLEWYFRWNEGATELRSLAITCFTCHGRTERAS
jgi:hypothetical protein